MSDNFQVSPPSYSDVIDKSVPPLSTEQVVAYIAPQQEQVDQIRYPTVPVAYGVQVIPLATLNKYPIQCTCAHCRSMIVTRVEQTNGILSWFICLILFLCGCWLGCCLIPFCISDLQNIQHYCPNCNTFIGEYRPL